jgi:cytochrome P450 monooxygenase
MAQTLAYTGTIAGIAIFLSICRAIFNKISYIKERNVRGCGAVKKYRSYDPILGLDFVLAMKKALNEHRWLPWQKQIFAAQGVKTFEANFFGSRMIYSSEADNMKAMSTSHWQEFGLQPIRYDNGVAQPFAGPGVSTMDGGMWQYSRDLIKPYFTRSEYSDLLRLEVHVDRLLDRVSNNGSTFDLQPLLQNWVGDPLTPLDAIF